MGETEADVHPRPVCLVKDCTGSDAEIRTWDNRVLRIVHEH
ncbi:hypothetical protein [Streptomyces sp. NBC_00892]|nr:hypothetical protein [Streptomyces sp. NBC_00892]MCX4894702.1 hypothetical protein [Streptomyces sp. NBC_00892]